MIEPTSNTSTAEGLGAHHRAPRLRRQLRAMPLIATLSLLALVLPGLYLWHSRQIRWGATAYLARADELTRDAKWAAAAESLFVYVRLRPDDPEGRIRLAEVYDRSATQPQQVSRAAELYYQALAVSPTDRVAALQRRLGELLLQLDRNSAAEVLAKRLLAEDPSDAAALRVLSLAMYGQAKSGVLRAAGSQPTAVGLALERAMEANPADVQVAVTLVDVYRHATALCSPTAAALSDEQRARLADRCFDRLVAAGPKDAMAYLARYEDRLARGQPQADADLEQALQIAPENPAVLLAAAERARRHAVDPSSAAPSTEREQSFEQASRYYDLAIRFAPALEPAYLGLAEVQLLRNEQEAAIQTWELALQKCGPESISLYARLAEALIATGQLERAEQCVNKLKSIVLRRSQRENTASRQLVERGVELLRARLLLARHDDDRAFDLLRRVGAASSESTAAAAVSFQVAMSLAGVYLTRGQSEQAAKSYEQAVAVRPEAVAPRLAAARIWMSLDRADLAAGHFEAAVALDRSADNYLLLAAAELRRQLRLPQAGRNWESFERVLADAKSILPVDSSPVVWKLGMIEAEYWLSKDWGPSGRAQSTKKALAVLHAVEKKNAASPAALAALASAYERLDLPTEADRALGKLRRLSFKTASEYLAQAAILAGRRQFEQARAALQSGCERVPEDQQRPLRNGLVELYLQEGRANDAWQAIVAARQEFPADRALLEKALEIATETGRLDDAERLEGEFRALGGVSTADWQAYRARRLIFLAETAQDQRLVEAEQLQRDIARRRPGWPVGQVLLGQIQERRGDSEKAIAAYQEAIRLGEQRPAVFERLVSLLYQLRRYDDADRCFADLRGRQVDSTELVAMESTLAVRSGQFDRAVDAARRAVDRLPADATAHVRLGRVLLAAGRRPEAESSLRRAVEIAPSDQQTYGALVDFCISTRQPALLRQTAVQLQENSQLPPPQRAVLLARCYEALGDRNRAQECVREATNRDPQNAQLCERLAALLLPDNPSEAEAALRQALKLDTRSGSARRMLATLLAERGGEGAWREALQLVEGATGEPRGPNDRRMHALLLVRRGGKGNLAEARRIVESLLASPRIASRDDRALLAYILETGGDVDAAKANYRALLDEGGTSAENLSRYIDFLLRRAMPEEAGPLLVELERLAADELPTVALRARWLLASGRVGELESLLEATGNQRLRLVGDSSKDDATLRAKVCSDVGDLYSLVGRNDGAERWYRRAYEHDSRRFDRLAIAVARQERVGEAIQLCVRAASSSPSSLPAKTLCTLLVQVRPSQRDLQQAEPVLAAALATYDQDAALFVSVANLRAVQRQSAEANDLYRRALQIQPTNVDALNNLAIVLAEQLDQPSEALAAVEQAIELVGSQPMLLDTKGTILLSLDKTGEAVELLSAAAATPNSDPRFHFHLALGYFRAGDVDNARGALRTARHRQLTRQVLTETDERLLAELDAKLR